MRYRFGLAELSTGRRRLTLAGGLTPIGGRAFDLLVALVEGRHTVMSSEALVNSVWDGRVVEENNLQVQVARLRKLLGASTIATVTGCGYRFCAEVVAEAEADDNAVAASPLAPAPVRAKRDERPLPRPLTPFVGFERECDQVATLLADARLVTLTGIGGSGKTRLAIEVAHLVQDRFKSRAAFVDLARMTDPAHLIQTIADQLGATAIADTPSIHAIVHHFGDTAWLVVLDNCEHVASECATLLERLLPIAPTLHVLATGRTALCLAGEHVVAMRTMTLPVPAEINLELLAQSESVEFFLGRARAAVRGFELVHANAVAIREICRQLDGIPLALELAAARVRVMSVGQIHGRLADRFRLLAGDAYTLGRRQTLLAALQWSVEHLDDLARALLQDLAVIASSWTLATCAAVGGFDDDLDAVDVLERLVAHALVVCEREGDVLRYRLLETVRQFALELGRASGRAAVARERFVDYMMAFARCHVETLETNAQGRALVVLDEERPNLLAALEACTLLDDRGATALEFVNTLRLYWINDRYCEAISVFERALASAACENCPTLARGWTTFALAQAHWFSGRWHRAATFGAEAIAIASRIGDTALNVYCLHLDAVLRAHAGDIEGARRSAQDALKLAHRSQSGALVSRALNATGVAARTEGDLAAARAAFETSLAALSTTDDAINVAHTHLYLVTIALLCDDAEGARTHLRAAIRVNEEAESGHYLHNHVWAAACLASVRRDWPRSARLMGAVDSFSVTNDLGGFAAERDLAGVLAQPRRILGDATHAQHHAAGHALPLPSALSEIIEWLDDETFW